MLQTNSCSLQGRSLSAGGKSITKICVAEMLKRSITIGALCGCSVGDLANLYIAIIFMLF